MRVQVEVVDGCATGGPHVERQIRGTAALAQQSFVLRGRFANGRPDPHPDATAEPYRGIRGWLHRHHGHCAAPKYPPLHRERRQRLYVTLAMDVRQPFEQLVVDRQRRARTVVPHGDQHHAGFSVARQVFANALTLRRIFLPSAAVSLRSTKSDSRSDIIASSSASEYVAMFQCSLT